MPWIETVTLEKARGVLKKEYEAAIKRAGTHLEHRQHHEHQPAGDEEFDGFLQCHYAWLLPTNALTA